MKILAFCPRCGKEQECFEDLHWNENTKAYKFVCDCMAYVKFSFRVSNNYECDAKPKEDWILQDIEALRS